MANGWNPVAIPVEGMAQMITQLREMAKAAGRNPAELKVIVRGNIVITTQPHGKDRWIFTGSLEQIKADIDQVRALGANEVFFDPTFSPDGETGNAILARMERMRRLVG